MLSFHPHSEGGKNYALKSQANVTLLYFKSCTLKIGMLREKKTKHVTNWFHFMMRNCTRVGWWDVRTGMLTAWGCLTRTQHWAFAAVQTWVQIWLQHIT